MVDNVTHLAPLGYSDHESLRGSYICYAEAPANETLSGSRNYPKGDYDVINESLSKTDWESKFHGNSVNTNWTELKKEISKTVRENVPLRNVKRKMNNKSPWWSKQMLRIVKRKYNLYKHYIQKFWAGHAETTVLMSNREMRQTLRLDKHRRTMKKKVINNCKKEPKKFYGYLRSKQKVKV